MKDEIKEILESLKPHNYIVKEYSLTLSIEEQKLLLDYITNLQEEVNKLTAESTEWESKYYDLQEKYEEADNDRHKLFEQKEKAIEYIKEENERLKKDLKTLWNVCWNNDTEMTSYQNEVFDNYYDMFHKNGGDE